MESSTLISQKLLETNEDILASLVENLQLGRLDDCMKQYTLLQSNLVSLATELDNFPAEETDPYEEVYSFPDEIMRRDVLEDLLPEAEKPKPEPPLIPACHFCGKENIPAEVCRNQLGHVDPSHCLNEFEIEQFYQVAQAINHHEIMAEKQEPRGRTSSSKQYKRWTDDDIHTLLIAASLYGVSNLHNISLVMKDRTKSQIHGFLSKRYKPGVPLPNLKDLILNKPKTYKPPPELASLFTPQFKEKLAKMKSTSNDHNKRANYLVPQNSTDNGPKPRSNDWSALVSMASGMEMASVITDVGLPIRSPLFSNMMMTSNPHILQQQAMYQLHLKQQQDYAHHQSQLMQNMTPKLVDLTGDGNSGIPTNQNMLVYDINQQKNQGMMIQPPPLTHGLSQLPSVSNLSYLPPAVPPPTLVDPLPDLVQKAQKHEDYENNTTYYMKKMEFLKQQEKLQNQFMNSNNQNNLINGQNNGDIEGENKSKSKNKKSSKIPAFARQLKKKDQRKNNETSINNNKTNTRNPLSAIPLSENGKNSHITGQIDLLNQNNQRIKPSISERMREKNHLDVGLSEIPVSPSASLLKYVADSSPITISNLINPGEEALNHSSLTGNLKLPHDSNSFDVLLQNWNSSEESNHQPNEMTESINNNQITNKINQSVFQNPNEKIVHDNHDLGFEQRKEVGSSPNKMVLIDDGMSLTNIVAQFANDFDGDFSLL